MNADIHSQTAQSTVLITGASGGIGADLARVFARHGHRLVLVARSQHLLDALADEISASAQQRPLIIVADLAQPQSIDDILEKCAQANVRISILVNNAGFGLTGLAVDLDANEQIEMIDLNVRTLTALTLRLLPDIIQTRGRIMNVASIAAFFPGPAMAVYYASKAFVLSFSQALSVELRPRRVSVSALCPGVTASGFQLRAGMSLAAVANAMPSMIVAEAGYKGLMAGKRVIVPGFANKVFSLLPRFVPTSWLMAAIYRIQAKRKS